MPDLTAAASLYLFLKTHAPAIFGALFSSQKVPRHNLTVLAWISAWVAVNYVGIIFVVVLSIYVGDFIAESRELSRIQANFMRLMIGLFGLKIINYFNYKLEPVLNELVDAALEKVRQMLGIDPKTNKEVIKDDDNR